MAAVSILILVLLGTVQLATASEFGRPISAELADGNFLAWSLMAVLAAMIVLFARRLKKNGHAVRTVLLLFDGVGLIVIAFTPRHSEIHTTVLIALCLMTFLWFIVAAIDYDCPHLVLLSAICFVLIPFLIGFGPGVAEKALILYAVYSTNVLYYLHLDPVGRQRWL